MNKTKGEIMNNFKKIGLTALAGSLAAVSANAVELSVSGETTVSYISNTAAKVEHYWWIKYWYINWNYFQWFRRIRKWLDS